MKKGLCTSFIKPFLLAALVTGCASVISKELRSQVTPGFTLETLRENPDNFRGEKVLFGGTIIKVFVKKDSTLLEVLEKPRGLRDMPKDTDTSGGRFLVHMNGYKDPTIYRKGRKITVFGEVVGKRIRKLGEMDYLYPLIRSEELYLWKEEEVMSPRFHFGLGIYHQF